jgi:putative sterol carrier protein
MSTARELMEGMKVAELDAKKAKGVDLINQYDLTGSDPLKWYVEIKDGGFKVVEGVHPKPAATIETTAETLTAMGEGKLKPMQAYMSRKMKVHGSFLKAKKQEDIFKPKK